jgi:hypothetical protein
VSSVDVVFFGMTVLALLGLFIVLLFISGHKRKE